MYSEVKFCTLASVSVFIIYNRCGGVRALRSRTTTGGNNIGSCTHLIFFIRRPFIFRTNAQSLWMIIKKHRVTVQANMIKYLA